MNVFKNLLKKVRALLKEDDQLTKAQCEQYQWQLLVKVGDDYTFTVGKGGVNTIFYSLSSEERVVCYPDEILTILEELANSKVFAYAACDKKKNVIGYSIDKNVAKKFKKSKYLTTVDFKGKKKIIAEKVADLYGKRAWHEIKYKK